MDRIVLSSADVETVLQWRDNNIELVRKNPAPFKGIILDFPETKITIKAINDNGRIIFYVAINGIRLGKISGYQLEGALFRIDKDTTNLKHDDVQSIITVYASLMALIVFHRPDPVQKTNVFPTGSKRHGKQKGKSKGKTYILKHRGSVPFVTTAGTRAKPSGVFGVRGHYRHYKDGRIVWVKPYKKGNGTEIDKTYKL